MKQLWSDTEVATLVNLFKQGRSIPEISEAIGRSRIAVSIKESKLRDRGVIGYRYPLICTVEGCGRPHASIGLCAMHYSREKRRRAKTRNGGVSSRSGHSSGLSESKE